jgi:ABC-type Na+ efflux pump, permease component
MRAITKKEIRSYFSSPTGYICIASIALIYGLFYYMNVISSGSTANVKNVYNAVFSFTMIIVPILTMKSMSEERKNKTDQALLTAPVTVTAISCGKFLGAFAVFFAASCIGLLPAVVLSFFGSPPWGLIMGNFIGALLYGGAIIAIGIFISSLTESQVIAAIVTFVVSMLLLFMDAIGSSIGNEFVSKIVSGISFQSRFVSFSQGVFSLPSAVFFISVISVFVFLTARRLESRRWS